MSSEAHVCILASTRTVCKQLYEPVQLVYAQEVCIRVVCCTTWCVVCIASTSLFTYIVCCF